MYESARENPERFFIGIDANARPLEKISEKIHRKPALPNALYLHASVEELPAELDGIANELRIHFPWGSLLRAALAPDPALRRLCAADALVRVVVAIDPERDRAELERLGIEPPTASEMALRYEAAGFEVIECGDVAGVRTSWAKRLRSRTAVGLTARRRPASSSD